MLLEDCRCEGKWCRVSLRDASNDDAFLVDRVCCASDVELLLSGLLCDKTRVFSKVCCDRVGGASFAVDG